MIKKTKSFLQNVGERISKRDFSGNSGLAIRNSIYYFSTNVILKIGSLVFTMVLARMLMPELFGLYSLALSTIVIFASFTDLGIGSALITFVAKKPKKEKGYFEFLIKSKLYLTFGVIIIFLILSYPLANIYYKKPIFLALLAGGLYILANSFVGFFSSLFQADNNFKIPFFKEGFFQILRLIILPMVIIFTISETTPIILFYIILSLSLCYLLSIFFLRIQSRRYSGKSLTLKDKKELVKFILPLSATVFSGTFFGYIDTILLGRFVQPEFIAFYQAAFSLAASGMVLISFGTVLLPIFSRIDKEGLKRGLKRALAITLLFSICAILFTIAVSSLAIFIIYGSQYTSAVPVLRILSLILFTDPLIVILTNYWTSQGKNVKIAMSVIISTIFNIILTYTFISYSLHFSMAYAPIATAIAGVLSRFVYLSLLLVGSTRKLETKTHKSL